MKKLKTTRLFAFMVVCLSTASVTSATAQGNLVARNDKQVAGLPMAAFETSDLGSSNSVVVSERIGQKFTKEFSGATNALWAKTNEGFMVRFTSNGIVNLAYLTKQGNCDHVIRYYTEKEMPAAVRHQVKSEYYDYAITSVKEVRHNEVTAYMVTVADATTWKVIRVVDGEADVLEAHVKG
jgi:hypothetical protein